MNGQRLIACYQKDTTPANLDLLLPCIHVSGHVLTCTCLNCTWREAFNCSVWIDFHIYMSGLGLIYLGLLRWSRYTWSSDWKRVIIIIIMYT
jgi:hypothetical protein